MASRKIYCEVVEGVTYDDRCLFKLSKVLDGNKSCESCVLRQLEILKRCGIKEPKDWSSDRPPEKANAGPKKKTKAKKIPRGVGGTKVIKVIKGIKGIKVINDINHISDMQRLNVHSLAKILGKSPRRIQELAKMGKIPGALKVEQRWVFNKATVDAWLSKGNRTSPQSGDVVITKDGSSNGEDPRPPETSEGAPASAGAEEVRRETEPNKE